jgi:protoporphyrinogen IX oxidase
MSAPLTLALTAHIVGLVYWLGGLIVAAQVMVRLGREGSPEGRRALGELEGKVLKGFVHPGAAVTVLAGIAILALSPEYLSQTWLHIKLVLVVVLIVVDLLLTIRFRACQAGQGTIEPGKARLYYGSIALLLLLIVFLAVAKPFS